MGHSEWYPWFLHKIGQWTFNKMWLTLNFKQCLWSTWVRSPHFVERETDHPTVVQKQVELGWTKRSSNEWQKWKNNLSAVEDIKIPRCYRPRRFERIINYPLTFLMQVYGQATYLRMVNDLEEVHCNLIFCKSRVVPVKYVFIPRLELTAATLSVKISKIMREELDIHISSEVFWTGSQVVLGYINNDSKI